MLSSSLEKYLMCIHQMLQTEKEIKSTDIAKQMNQPLQKVIQALQRLHYQKHIVYSAYQPLKLTDKGKSMAEYLSAREALISEFLGLLHIDVGSGGEKDAMEQYLSYDSLEKIEKFVLFNRRYPEISARYALVLKMDQKNRLLPPLPQGEK